MGGSPIPKQVSEDGKVVRPQHAGWNRRLLHSAPAQTRLNWNRMGVISNARILVTNDDRIHVAVVKEGYPTDGPKRNSPQFRTTLLEVNIYTFENPDDIPKDLAEISSTKPDLQSQTRIRENLGAINALQKKIDRSIDLGRLEAHAAEVAEAIKEKNIRKVLELCSAGSP